MSTAAAEVMLEVGLSPFLLLATSSDVSSVQFLPRYLFELYAFAVNVRFFCAFLISQARRT
jgi:hypothetical protein